MIEMVYNGKESKGQSEVRLPKNIRQIGDNNSKKKIYVEDYVMSNLKEEPENEDNIRYGVLLGETKKVKGYSYIFVKGMAEVNDVIENSIIFNDEIWTNLYKDIKRYFDEFDIVGWFISVPYRVKDDMSGIKKIHLDNFAGNDKVCFLSDRTENEDGFFVYENGNLNRQSGYYIYYEKNEKMKKYVREREQNKNSINENLKENIKNNKKTDGKIIKENDEQLIKEEANKYNGENENHSVVMNKASSKSKNQKSENDEEANTKSGQTIEMPDILGKKKKDIYANKQVDNKTETPEKLNVKNKQKRIAEKNSRISDSFQLRKAISERKKEIENQHKNGSENSGKVSKVAVGISGLLIIALLLSTIVMLNNYGELKNIKTSLENINDNKNSQAVNQIIDSLSTSESTENNNETKSDSKKEKNDKKNTQQKQFENGQNDDSSQTNSDDGQNSSQPKTDDMQNDNLSQTQQSESQDNSGLTQQNNSSNTQSDIQDNAQSQPNNDGTGTETEPQNKSTNVQAGIYGGAIHTVTPGQTLYDISMTYYGNSDMVDRIKAFNGIGDDYKIIEGQQIKLP